MNTTEPLTSREREVLACINRGLSNREIAEELVISVATVQNHLHSIYGKLGVSSRLQATVKTTTVSSSAEEVDRYDPVIREPSIEGYFKRKTSDDESGPVLPQMYD